MVKALVEAGADVHETADVSEGREREFFRDFQPSSLESSKRVLQRVPTYWSDSTADVSGPQTLAP